MVKFPGVRVLMGYALAYGSMQALLGTYFLIEEAVVPRSEAPVPSLDLVVIEDRKESDNRTVTSTIKNTAETKSWSNLKVAIYMTTHLSKEHLEFLSKCWPTAIRELPLLRDADLILYTSANATEELLNKLPFRNITVRRYTEKPLPPNFKQIQFDRKKQIGAMQAIIDPFKAGNDWFAGYDWVIRLNPDVLIRRDDWLRETMLNETVDAILLPYVPDAVHTVFTVFRPSVINKTALLKTRTAQMSCAEFYMYVGLAHVMQSDRWARLPYAERIPRTAARVVGKQSLVIHHHDLHKYCPNYFNATQGDVF